MKFTLHPAENRKYGPMLHQLRAVEAYSRLGSIKLAADEMHTSERTVEGYLHGLFDSLGIADSGNNKRSIQAFRVCLEQGWIRMEED